MKTITIIGVGMSLDTATQEGYAAIRDAEVFLGAPRLLALFSSFEKPAFPAYLPDGVLRVLEETGAERYAVVLSGDVGFFSAANVLLPALNEYSVRLIPGISSLSYFSRGLLAPGRRQPSSVATGGRTTS
ncbi:MAG: SAM-dependent methyltransferase [Eubacteriales bacterium]